MLSPVRLQSAAELVIFIVKLVTACSVDLRDKFVVLRAKRAQHYVAHSNYSFASTITIPRVRLTGSSACFA